MNGIYLYFVNKHLSSCCYCDFKVCRIAQKLVTCVISNFFECCPNVNSIRRGMCHLASVKGNFWPICTKMIYFQMQECISKISVYCSVVFFFFFFVVVVVVFLVKSSIKYSVVIKSLILSSFPH